MRLRPFIVQYIDLHGNYCKVKMLAESLRDAEHQLIEEYIREILLVEEGK